MKPSSLRLKNGMTAILVPQKGAESVTVFMLIRVGSRYESKEINGASHFIEHMMFKGTKRRPTAQHISRELDRFGAFYNAYTGKDQTAYFVKIDASHIDQAVDLLNDMVFHSTFDSKEIERERGVIVEEINMYEDNPRMQIDILLEHALFPSSSLGWDIAGPREVVKKISRKELVAFRDALYLPSRIAVVVAGNLPSDIASRLESTVGKVASSSRAKNAAYQPFVVPKRRVPAMAYREKKTEQTQVGIGFYGYPSNHANETAARLLAIILGGYMSSRLFTEIREKKGLCYSISAGYDAFEDVGVFSIYAGLDRARLPLAIKTILAELDRVKRSGVTEEELLRAKDHIKGTIALAFEDSSFQAGWYGRQWLFGKDLETPEVRMKAFSAVTRTEIREVARELFCPERMASAVIGPHGKKATLEKYFKWE